MKNIFLFISFFLIQNVWCQSESIKIFKGQLVNDSTKVENVIIFNLNSRVGTTSKKDGLFDISAKTNDTISFTSVVFRTKKIVVSDFDLGGEIYFVHLNQFKNHLKQIDILNKKIVQTTENTQKYVDKQYFDDAQSSPKTTNVYDGQTPGVNAVRLFKDILKFFKNRKSDVKEFNFSENTLERVKYSFFRESLKLHDEEIILFLLFCEVDYNANIISKSENLLNLIDFLYNRNKEFKKIQKGS